MKRQDVKDMAQTICSTTGTCNVILEQDAMKIFDEYKKLKKAIKKHKKTIGDVAFEQFLVPADIKLWEVLDDN